LEFEPAGDVGQKSIVAIYPASHAARPVDAALPFHLGPDAPAWLVSIQISLLLVALSIFAGFLDRRKLYFSM